MARLVAADGTEVLVGIRTNDVGAVVEIERRLGRLLADTEPFSYPNIGIQIGGRRGTVADKHVVYRRGQALFHTADREQAIEAALAQLHTLLPAPSGVIPMHARALMRDGAVVVASDSFASPIDVSHRRLAAAGYQLLPHSPVLVDCAAAEALIPRFGDLGAPEYDRVPVSHIFAAASPMAPDDPAAIGLLQIRTFVVGRHQPLRSDHLRDLAALTAAVPVVRLPYWDPRLVADALLAL